MLRLSAPGRAEAALVLLGLLLKLAAAALLPLTDDEAYYWVWGQHLRLSYYDHPAMIALLYWLGDHVRWLPGMVRWPGVLLSQATLVLWLRILRPYLDEPQRCAFLGLALLSPMIEARGGVLVEPDLPLMFFYAVSALIYLKWRERPTLALAFALGLAMGLGFASKYMMIVFALALAPIPFFDADVRRLLPRHLPVLIVGGLIGSSPVWIWNATHGFASFQFQFQSRVGHGRWSLLTPLSFVGAQLILIFPPVAYWAARDRRLPVFVRLIAWTPLAFFFAMSLRVVVQGKWPSVAYLPLFALAASSYPRNRLSLRATMGIWAVALAFAASVMALRPSFIPAKAYQTCDCSALAAAAKGLDPLYASTYQIAAQLQNLLGRPVYKLRGMTRVDEYDFLPQSEPKAARFYVAAHPGDRLPARELARGERIIHVTPVDKRHEIWTVDRN